jgi:hypothetical protein
MNKQLLLIFLIGVSHVALGQSYKTRHKKNDPHYYVKMKADTINGIYIPKDLKDCFVELDKLLTTAEKMAMKNLKSGDDMKHYHMGLGTWIRNNWGLWPGSRLQKYFTDKGFDNPEGMSTIILKFYYDWLNGKNDKWSEWVAAKSSRKS